METSAEFNKNDTEQQQQQEQQTTAASIVSSMTTATPITSEIISDFEPDPKFDITPLERASYDCQEIYSIDSSLDQHEQDVQQQSLSEINDDTSRASSSDPPNMQSEQNMEKDQSNKGQHETNILEQTTRPPQAREGEKSQTNNDNSLEQANKTSEGPSLSEITPSLSASENNDCNSGKTHQNEAEMSITSARDHPIQLEASNIDLFEPIEDHSVVAKAPAQIQGRQQFNNESHMQTQPQSNTEHDMSNLLSLSRQVIDNVVELGDVHQFSQSLGHPETEEKLLDIQSIHRDLISERSSIDLIADVASRQQSIEIAPVSVPAVQEKREPCPSSAQRFQEPDLMKSDNITNISKPEEVVDHTTGLQPADVNKPTPESNLTAMEKLESPEIKQDSGQPKIVDDENIERPPMDIPPEPIIEESVIEESVIEEHVTEEPVIEEPMIEETAIEEAVTDLPIIEEPADSSNGEQVQRQVEQEPEPKDSTTQIVELEPILVEPFNPTDVSAKELHLEPVVEEAPSTDDDDLQQNAANMETKMDGENLSTDHLVAKPEASKGVDDLSKNDFVPEDKVDVNKHESPEPGIRRSGRKIKVSEKAVEIERSTSKRSRRASKIEEKGASELVASKVTTTIMDTAESYAPNIDKAEDLGSPEKTNETTVEPTIVTPTSLSEEVQEVAVEKPDVESITAAESLQDDETEVRDTTRSTRAVRERLVKALRPRESSKRGRDEDEPSKLELPKIEPPKRQVKKMRGATGDSPPKNKPSIKLPNYRSRQTISTSDPITRLDKRFESETAPASSQPDSDRGFKCKCGFTTTRLNNMMYHSLRGYCPGKCIQGEVMKADITRQQQTPKSKRKSIR